MGSNNDHMIDSADTATADVACPNETDPVDLLNAVRENASGGNLSLAQAIGLLETLQALPDPSQDVKVQWKKLLVELLCKHNETTNESNALEQALEYLCELAQDTMENDWPNTTWIHYWQSRCLRNRYMRNLNNPQDLENAIWSAEYADTHTQLTESLNLSEIQFERKEQLWFCLFTKVQDSDEILTEIIERVIVLALEMDQSTSDASSSHENHTKARNNLGMSYQLRWDKLQDSPEDLISAVKLGYEVVDLSSGENQEDALIDATSNLAFRLQRAHSLCLNDAELQRKFGVSEATQILDDAFKYINQSTSIHGSQISARAINTLAFVASIKRFASCDEHARSMLGRCYSMLRRSVEDLQQILATATTTDLREGVGTFYGIARYCAAAGLQADVDPCEVLALLELGRSVSRSTQFRYDTVKLAGTCDSSILDEYKDAKDKLSSLVAQESPYHQRKEASDRVLKARQAINVASGFTDDNGNLSAAALMTLAEECDIVVVNITDIRSDAILVSKKTGITSVLLPDLLEDVLSEMSWEIQIRLAQDKDQEEIYAELQAQLSALLRHLWKSLVNPVLKVLECDKVQALSDLGTWPHVKWIPTGILSLYPIHAAGLGLHTTRNTMNHVISMYASDLASLWACQMQKDALPQLRRHSNQTLKIGAETKIGIISLEETPGRQPLEYSRMEADAISSCFDHFKVIRQPTTEAVLSFLTEEIPLLHFSCHGEVDYDFPSQSKLLTTDWATNPLTVDHLRALNIRSSALAFLSACFTANAGVEYLQDETSHLSLAFQAAGIKNVVGSLWYVGQEAAFETVVLFYQQLRNRRDLSSKAIAECLHVATFQYAQRTQTPANRMRGDPVTWAPFLHFV